MSLSTDNGFKQLWPTLFLERALPGFAAPNTLLRKIILEQDSQQENLTTDYRSQDFFQAENPALEWLKACINKTVADYFKQQGFDYPVNWNLQAWANVNRHGDYHNIHNHPHSYLSGTYYVSIPEQPVTQRQDLNPGCISFFDPRAQANMSAIRGDQQIDPEYRVQPTPGMLLLWPSFIHHFVHPNLAESERLSLSFNVVLQKNSSQLPDQ